MSLAIKLALSPLLVAQAVAVRRRASVLPEAAGPREGRVGRGPTLSLLVAGDSSAAGVGVPTQQQALAAPLARLLAEDAGVRVHWRLVARTGLTTAGVHALVREHAGAAPLADVAVVVTGVNDVAEQVPSMRALAHREAFANWLRNAAGVRHVVFAPLPPMGRFAGLPQPLRWVAGHDARRHDAALAAWAQDRQDVSRAPIDLALNRGVMAPDGYHPGEPVYRQCAVAIARHLTAEVLPSLGWTSSPRAPAPEGRPFR
jgi:lysophospholipase L1-like esterase